MRVGVLHPRKGVTGLWTPSMDAATVLAAAEINDAGGIRGEGIELLHEDCGLQAQAAIAAVDRLIQEKRVDAIVGQHTSNVRNAILDRVNGRVPYIYAAQHEGPANARSEIAIGPTDGELLWPAISWMIEQKGARRFFFVGNDYIWPEMAFRTSRSLIAHEGAHLVGHAFLSFGHADYSKVLHDIRLARPDVVVQALVGESSVRFNRAFASVGLDSGMLRLGLLVDENVTCAIGASATQDLFAVSNYFSSVRSKQNSRFLDAYHRAHGVFAPPVSPAGIGCYEGVHLLAALVGQHKDKQMALNSLAGRPLDRRTARQHLGDKPVGRGQQVHIAAAEDVSLRVVATLSSN